MERKKRIRTLGSTLLLVGAGALGVVAGTLIYTFVPVQDLIPQPPTPIPTEAPPLPTATAGPEWVVTYEYRFPPDPLLTGRNTYEIFARCPNGYAESWQGEYNVSGTALVNRNRVYLRTTGVMSAALDGAPVGPLHPDQLLGAALTFRYATLDEAETARGACTVHVSVNGRPATEMSPAIPRERVPE
jgi:hypothetical protein